MLRPPNLSGLTSQQKLISYAWTSFICTICIKCFLVTQTLSLSEAILIIPNIFIRLLFTQNCLPEETVHASSAESFRTYISAETDFICTSFICTICIKCFLVTQTLSVSECWPHQWFRVFNYMKLDHHTEKAKKKKKTVCINNNFYVHINPVLFYHHHLHHHLIQDTQLYTQRQQYQYRKYWHKSYT